MNGKKETLQLFVNAASAVTGQPIGLPISALSLLLGLTSNEEDALYKFLEYMSAIVREKTDKGNDSQRNDWYHENIGSDVSARMMKKTFETLKNEIEEKKEKHIAYFCGNIHLESNNHVSISMAIEILNKIVPLTYKQLCVIKYINESPKTKILKNMPTRGHFTETEFSDYFSKMPKDKISDYFSTCREMIALRDEGFAFQGVQASSTVEGGNPVIERLPLEIGNSTDLATQIYALAELSKIPEEDMQETFQYWEEPPLLL